MSADNFTLADRDLCGEIADEFSRANLCYSADEWNELRRKIGHATAGMYAKFDEKDVALVAALQRSMQLTALNPAEGYREKARAVSRLGMLVLMASKGRLPQLRQHT